MDLDAEFEKLYGNTERGQNGVSAENSEQGPSADLDAEFERQYGPSQEPPPDSRSTTKETYESDTAAPGKVQLRDLNGANARLLMSQVGNKAENVEMPKHVKRAESVKHGGMTVTSDGVEWGGAKTKVGGFVNVEDADGNVRVMTLKEINEGRPVLEYDGEAKVKGVGGTGATIPSGDFEKLLKDGKVRYDMTVAEQIQKEQQAETGKKRGVTESVVKAVLDPIIGNVVSISDMEEIKTLDELRHGRVSKEPMSSPDDMDDDERLQNMATYGRADGSSDEWERAAGRVLPKDVARRQDGEDDESYHKRIRNAAAEEWTARMRSRDAARADIEHTEKGDGEKILGGLVNNLGYMLPYAGAAKIAGGIANKAIGTAVKIMLPAAFSYGKRYEELTSDDYEDNGLGFYRKVHDRDDAVTAVFKAAAGSIAESTLEEFGGKIVEWPAGKVFKGAVNNLVKKGWRKPIERFTKKFMEYGEAFQFTSPVGELAEEYEQFVMDDLVGLAKKSSEYKGFKGEVAEARKDGGMLTGEGLLDTFYGLVGTMGIFGAAAVAGATQEHIRTTKDAKDYLASCGMSNEQIESLSGNDLEAIRRLHNSFKDDPKALHDALEMMGGELGRRADELVQQMTYKLEKNVADYGEQPHRFEFQQDADGKPKFANAMHTSSVTGKSGMSKEMFDPIANVTIVDTGSGFQVYNETNHQMMETDNLQSAIYMADAMSLKNQKRTLDNERKRQYAENVAGTKFKNRSFAFVEGAHEFYQAVRRATEEGGSFHGVTMGNIGDYLSAADGTSATLQFREGDAGGITLADGETMLLIGDNIESPQDMVRVMSHETGHVAGREDVEARRKMLARVDPDSELGRMTAAMLKRNEDLGLGYSEGYVREEAFSQWLEKRGHNPTLAQRMMSRMFGSRGMLNDADLEVIANKIEKRSEAGADGSFNTVVGRTDESIEAPEAEDTPVDDDATIEIEKGINAMPVGTIVETNDGKRYRRYNEGDAWEEIDKDGNAVEGAELPLVSDIAKKNPKWIKPSKTDDDTKPEDTKDDSKPVVSEEERKKNHARLYNAENELRDLKKWLAEGGPKDEKQRPYYEALIGYYEDIIKSMHGDDGMMLDAPRTDVTIRPKPKLKDFKKPSKSAPVSTPKSEGAAETGKTENAVGGEDGAEEQTPQETDAQFRERVKNDAVLKRIDAAQKTAKTDAERDELTEQFKKRIAELRAGAKVEKEAEHTAESVSDGYKLVADRHVVTYGNGGNKATLAQMIQDGMARLHEGNGLVKGDKGPYVVTIGFEHFKPWKAELPYLRKVQAEYDAREKNAPADADELIKKLDSGRTVVFRKKGVEDSVWKKIDGGRHAGLYGHAGTAFNREQATSNFNSLITEGYAPEVVESSVETTSPGEELPDAIAFPEGTTDAQRKTINEMAKSQSIAKGLHAVYLNDDTGSLSVEYTDGAGTKRKYLVTPDGHTEGNHKVKFFHDELGETKKKTEKKTSVKKPSVTMKDAKAEAEAIVDSALDDFIASFDTKDLREKQTALSGGTSRNQNPSGNEYGKKWKIFKPGTRNVDIGAGRFDKATEFLAAIGVTNIPFDPVNRPRAVNEASAQEIRENPAETTTVHNVLNVIDNDSVVDGIINQAARAIKKDGWAIFTIYEGNRTGVGNSTRDGYQRNEKASEYIPLIKKFFGLVERHGNVITARQPKDVGPAFWAYDSDFEDGVMFDTKNLDVDAKTRQIGHLMRAVDGLVKIGAGNFREVASRIYDKCKKIPGKFNEIRPVLHSLWNVVSSSLGIDEEVSKKEAEEIYDTITSKETSNGSVREPGNADDGNVHGVDGVQPQDDSGASSQEGPGAVASGNREEGAVEPVQPVGQRRGEGEFLDGHEVPEPDAEPHGKGKQGGVEGASGVAQGKRPSSSDRRGASGGESVVPVQPGQPADVQRAATAVSPETPSNYVITDDDRDWLDNSTPSQKVENNIRALEILVQLDEEGRSATPEEKTVLARYVGFGAFPQIVDKKYRDAYAKYGDTPSEGLPAQTRAALRDTRFGIKGYDNFLKLKKLMTADEMKSMEHAILTAYFTPIHLCRTMNRILRRAGLTTGRLLESSAGTGNMIGTGEYDNPSWLAVELDRTTGKILQHLYPLANVKIKGFEQTQIPTNFVDGAITNVPFLDISPNDPEYNRYGFPLHDYFIARIVDRMHVGGVAAIITSHGTLDKTNKDLIRYLSEHGGKIVGSVRLPNEHQKGIAGTYVAADLIFIQKVGGTADNSAYMRNGQILGLNINQYYVDHPDMIGGEPFEGKSMYGPQKELNVRMTLSDEELDALAERAAEGLTYTPANEVPNANPILMDADGLGLRSGNIGIDANGRVVKRVGDVLEVIDVSAYEETRTDPKTGKRRLAKWPESLTRKGFTLKRAVQDLVDLRNAYRAYVDAQKNGTDEDVEARRIALNAEYDGMTARYGSFNGTKAMKFLFDLDDADGIVLQQLESYDNVPDGIGANGRVKYRMENFRKSDALLKRTLFRSERVGKAKDVSDGLRIVLNECGRVNVRRIAELTGKSEGDVTKELLESGHVFQNPATGGLETRDEYLSGSVRRKLREAKAAAEVDAAFDRNVEELEKVQPSDKPATKIKYQIGQKFIPNDMYREFIGSLIGLPAEQVTVGFDEKRDSWIVGLNGRPANLDYANRSPIDLESLLVRIFNGSSLTIKEKVDDHYVVNEKKTEQANQIAKDLNAALAKWMVAEPERALRIERAYNDAENDNVERVFDPDLITLDGISDAWAKRVNTPGYEHQKRTVARAVLGGNLGIFHCVGAGKSFEMFASIMQLRRLGLAYKPMLTVPTHMVESRQIYKEFMQAFPGARILVAQPSDLKAGNRKKFLSKAANGDWDCIVVAHSSFSLIGMDPKAQAEYVQSELDELEDSLRDARKGKDKRSEKKIQKKIEQKRQKLDKLLNAARKDDTIPFENLGVDYLFVDEAHNFKGIDITTRMTNVGGVTGAVSQRAQDMEMKCQYLAKIHGADKGVVFATGTPISNSISEMYTMARFLAPTKLREMGIYRFDDWARTFGVVESTTVPKASGKGYKEATRFVRFQNLVELKRIYFGYADVVLDGDLTIVRPKMVGGAPIVHKVSMDETQKRKVEELDKRLDSFSGSRIDPKIDNPLKVVTEGRLAAIDPALLGLPSEHRRLEQVADEVYRTWKESTGKTGRDGAVLDGTQLVFCDSGVPKEKKFKKVYRLPQGGFSARFGNFWTFTVSNPDTNGLRHVSAVRSDGATLSTKPFVDHGRNGEEDVSTVYLAFEEMANEASAYDAEHRLQDRRHAPNPVGESFDINGWLDENGSRLGYDVRFENPFAGERATSVEDEDDDDVVEVGDSEGEDEDDSEDQSEKVDESTINMLRGKFNVYAYLKQALVRRGIPADEIAFIHDAENSDQKRMMFEEFNGDDTRGYRGGKRIIIGNTPKMGEGANVQKRLVAIHHVDVPWKPAWLTQRDGRGIRAGNVNEEIAIHRYITEGTFDVYSYDKVSTKQQFMDQVQSHDLSQDEIEDMSDAVLSAEEAKAAAAGEMGRYMLESTKLENAIRKVQLAYENQVSDVGTAEYTMRGQKSALDDAIKKYEAAVSASKSYGEAKGNAGGFVFTTDGGIQLTETKDIAKYVELRGQEPISNRQSVRIGTIFGFDVNLHRVDGSLMIVVDGMPTKYGNARSNMFAVVGGRPVVENATITSLKASVTQATGQKSVEELKKEVDFAQKRFDNARAALENATVDESLLEQVREMTIRLAEVNKILGRRHAWTHNDARSFLQKRIDDGVNVEENRARLEALGEISKKQSDDGAQFDTKSLSQLPNRDAREEQMDARGIKERKRRRLTSDLLGQEVEALRNQKGYVEKLIQDLNVYGGRNLSAAETVAVGEVLERSKFVFDSVYERYTEAKDAYDAAKEDEDLTADELKELKTAYLDLKDRLNDAKRALTAVNNAYAAAGTAWGQEGVARRASLADDFTFAGLMMSREKDLGRDLTEEEEAVVLKMSEKYRRASEEQREMVREKMLKAGEAALNDMARVAASEGRALGDASDKARYRRARNRYIFALDHIRLVYQENGGTLHGLSGNEFATYNRALQDMMNWYFFENPDITIDEARARLMEEVMSEAPNATPDEISLTWTGYGRNWERYKSYSSFMAAQARAVELERRKQADIQSGVRPSVTGGFTRFDDTPELRAARRETNELRKELDETNPDQNKIQGYLESREKWYEHRIEEIASEILNEERTPRKERTIRTNARIETLKKQLAELRAERDKVFNLKNGMTVEERLAHIERHLEDAIEDANDKLARYRSGDFGKKEVEHLTSPRVEELRNRLRELNERARQIRLAKNYWRGMSEEETAKWKQKRLEAQKKRLEAWTDKTKPGADIYGKKPTPIPWTPEEKKEWDLRERRIREVRRQVQELRIADKERAAEDWARGLLSLAKSTDALFKTVKATADASMIMRQCARLTLTHPNEAAKLFYRNFGSLFDERKAMELLAEVEADPLVREAIDNGWLKWRTFETGGVSSNDEMIGVFGTLTKILRSIPKTSVEIPASVPVFGGRRVGLNVLDEARKGFERQFVVYSNVLSAYEYLTLVNGKSFFAREIFGPDGVKDDWRAKMEIAKLINISNGTSNIKGNNAVVNLVAWAPKLAWTRVQQATGMTILRPLMKGAKIEGGRLASDWYKNEAERKADTEGNKRAAKLAALEACRMGQYLTTMTVLGTLLLRAFGDDDDWREFANSGIWDKFRKATSPKIGMTNVDLTGGMSSFWNMAEKIIRGNYVNGSGRTVRLADDGDGHKASFGMSRMVPLWRYLRGKMNPLVSDVMSIVEGKDFVGNEYGIKEFLLGLKPLGLTQSATVLASDMTPGQKAVAIAAAMLGAGGSTYDRNDYGRLVNPFIELNREYDKAFKDYANPGRKARLEAIRASSPLMQDKVRNRINAILDQVKVYERTAKMYTDKGLDVPPSTASAVESRKAAVMQEIRRVLE